MSVKLILKNSKVQFKNATSAQLANAELAINFHESGPYLQAKGDDGTVHAMGGVYIEDAAPSNPLPGRWWYNSGSEQLFLYDGSTWKEVGGGGGGGGTTTVIGGDGIKATTSGSTVTVSVDLATDSNGLSIASNQLQADLATESSAGTVIVGDGLSIDALGVLSADGGGAGDLNPLAGRALTYNGGTTPETLNADIATASAVGVVSVGSGIDVDADGEISVTFPEETFIGENPPESPVAGDLWWNSSDDSGRLYVYYDEGPGGSQQWVEASPQGDTLTESDADDLYLSKVSDDTAEGAITFEKHTTHEFGINLTGGGFRQGTLTSGPSADGGVHINEFVRVYGNLTDFPEADINDSQPFQILAADTEADNKSVRLSLNASGSAYFAGLTEHASGIIAESNGTYVVNSVVKPTNGAADAVSYRAGAGASSTAKDAIGFLVDSTYRNNLNADLKIGFRADLNTETGKPIYNFYAQGTAPNYFAGSSLISADPDSQLFSETSTDEGCKFNTDGLMLVRRNVSSQNATAFFTTIRNTDTSVNSGNTTQLMAEFKFINSDNTDIVAGALRFDGSGSMIVDTTSDYRTKQNVVDLPLAAETIKALRPVNYNYNWSSVTRPGFIAHELQEVVPVAVIGDKDATEAIGTLADYDGTVLEAEVTEPPAEELEYTEEVETDGVSTQEVRTRTWTATGTRPVYQGVDQTKLIPLLTKALQEVLTKNEDLEARIAALEGA